MSEKQKLWAADDAWRDGVRAYALKQAWVRRTQAAHWGASFIVARMEATTFLSTHSAEGFCTTEVDGLMDSVEAMSLQKVDDELD